MHTVHTDTQTHLQHCKLQDLISLLLAAGKALIHIAIKESGVHVQHLKLRQ